MRVYGAVCVCVHFKGGGNSTSDLKVTFVHYKTKWHCPLVKVVATMPSTFGIKMGEKEGL